jgi:hypothetical protein
MFLLAIFAPRLVQNQGIRGWSQWSVISGQEKQKQVLRDWGWFGVLEVHFKS